MTGPSVIYPPTGGSLNISSSNSLRISERTAVRIFPSVDTEDYTIPPPTILMDFGAGVYQSGGSDVSVDNLLAFSSSLIGAGFLDITTATSSLEAIGDLKAALISEDGFTIVIGFDVEDVNVGTAHIFEIHQGFDGNHAVEFVDCSASGGQGNFHIMRVQKDDESYAELYETSGGNNVIRMAFNFSSAGVASSFSGGDVASNHNAQSITGAFNQAFFGGPNSESTPGENSYIGYMMNYLAVYSLQPEQVLPTLSTGP